MRSDGYGHEWMGIETFRNIVELLCRDQFQIQVHLLLNSAAAWILIPRVILLHQQAMELVNVPDIYAAQAAAS